jgi:UDP-N-acetylmuramoylalanine--D-glutamate ligase
MRMRGVSYRSGSAREVTFSIKSAAADFSLMMSGERRMLARRGEALLDLARLKITGLHNAANALAALALGEAVGLPMPAMLAALEEFPGLPHRSAWVADVAGVRYIDDSKGTNVGATIAAVDGLSGPLVMIAGGEGKGQDFSPLAEAFRGKVRAAVLIGKDAPALGAALTGVCPVYMAASMEAAVRQAHKLAQRGDSVLLSPACASLDMFRDYAERGDVFAAAALALESDAP